MSTKLYLYKIDPNYLRFLHSIDSRISVKYNNRPFVGIITMINGINYVLPLTSQTTIERKKNGYKKRSPLITTYIKDRNDNEISNILHNNMFPVKDGVFTKLNIDSTKNSYELNEIRYIRKNSEKIISKANKVYLERISNHNPFYEQVCCDFYKLETNYQKYEIESSDNK